MRSEAIQEVKNVEYVYIAEFFMLHYLCLISMFDLNLNYAEKRRVLLESVLYNK
jgi:hypothetical protein